MGVLKERRLAKRLRAKAEADPAVRDSWMRRHDLIFIGFQAAGIGPNAYNSTAYRAMLEEHKDGPPSRQELEYSRSMCEIRGSALCPRAWLPAIAAIIEAIDEMLPYAAAGPSNARYP